MVVKGFSTLVLFHTHTQTHTLRLVRSGNECDEDKGPYTYERTSLRGVV